MYRTGTTNRESNRPSKSAATRTDNGPTHPSTSITTSSPTKTAQRQDQQPDGERFAPFTRADLPGPFPPLICPSFALCRYFFAVLLDCRTFAAPCQDEPRLSCFSPPMQ